MPKRSKPRNLHACHPIMSKGGVHQKSKGAQRAAAKRDTRKKASEWLGRSSFWRGLVLIMFTGLNIPIKA